MFILKINCRQKYLRLWKLNYQVGDLSVNIHIHLKTGRSDCIDVYLQSVFLGNKNAAIS